MTRARLRARWSNDNVFITFQDDCETGTGTKQRSTERPSVSDSGSSCYAHWADPRYMKCIGYIKVQDVLYSQCYSQAELPSSYYTIDFVHTSQALLFLLF